MIKLFPFCITIVMLLLLMACQNTAVEEVSQEEETAATAFADAPTWAKDVIWYQIFVERFRNGDPNNDPKAEDLVGAYPGFVPDDWAITPWTQDWYRPDPYFASAHGKAALGGGTVTEFHQKQQLRRYGGDLQGVMDQLDYLESLGITAIYFNPLNDSPSLHKYDPRHWRHIDRNFGPSPAKDIETIANEDPTDPSTWQWTGADQLFLDLIQELKKRNIRVIMDYSWNHTGQEFWALKDIEEKGEASAYKDWFYIESFDDPNTPENEFDYKGWVGIKSLPEIKETEHYVGPVKAFEGDVFSEAVKQHIFAISKRWLDPNGDGDPSDGVDGFRLDVAGEMPLGWWRDYRKFVRGVNPEAYLVGEIWWEEWPDKLLDPKPFLEGDVFDAVMNYRWYRAARQFFARAPEEVPVSRMVDSLKAHASNLRETSNYAMMNLTASHDVPRFATSMFNKNKYKFHSTPSADNPYKIHKPDAATRNAQKLLLAQQFTFVGAPHIWAGDEMGMWGADDPACRKPLIWRDMEFESETTHPQDAIRPTDEVKFDEDLFAFYQKLIQIRKANPVLADGDLTYLTIDDEKKVLAYSRYNESKEVISFFNTSEEAQTIEVPVKLKKSYENAFAEGETWDGNKGTIEVRLAPESFLIVQ